MAAKYSIQSFEEFRISPEAKEAKNVTEFYDNWVLQNEYDKELTEDLYQAPQKTGLVVSSTLVDRSVRILDCGCGTGLVGAKLNSFGFNNLVGMDLSQNSVDIARQKGIYTEVVCCDTKNTGFESNEFDALVLVGCLSAGHVTQTSFPEFIRVVKPGGQIFLTMRLKTFENAEPFNEGKMMKAICDLEKAEKWKLISQEVFPKYLNDDDGIIFIFKVI